MLRRVRKTLTESGSRIAALLLALAAFGLLSQRISDHLGYEFAQALAMLVAIGGGACGIAAARVELRDGQPALPVRAAMAGSLAAVLCLALPLALALGNGLFRPACDNPGGLVLFFLLPVPSAALAGTTGALCGFFWPRRAGGIYAAVLLGALAIAAWPALTGPQAFAYSHLLGYFPGPLYDEALQAQPALFWFRAASVAWLFLLWGMAGLVAHGVPVTRTGTALLITLGLVTVAIAEKTAELAGWATSATRIDAALGGIKRTAHCVLHYPREKPAEEVRLLAEDAEFRTMQDAAFLGIPMPSRPTDIFLYRNPEEKRALVGAAHTSFAKPWLRQLHIQDAGFPHPVLKHELAHVLAGDLAPRPLRVPARAWVLVNAGLVEGLAVAADGAGDDELTLHGWAAAMRKAGLAPDLPSLLGVAGFYAAAPARAYTYAGSFLRFLTDTRGNAVLRAVYADGDFAAAFGTPLDVLISAHATFLDGLALPERGRALAADRFHAVSIFHRTCAREIAALSTQADASLDRADYASATSDYLRCAALEPDDPAYLLDLFEVAAQRGDRTLALSAAKQARAKTLSAQQRAHLAMREGDLAWSQNDIVVARERYQAALAEPIDTALTRLLTAKRTAIDQPSSWSALRAVLVDGKTGLAELLHLREIDGPASGLARYLIGRQLANRAAPADALYYFGEALARGLPSPELQHEAERLDALMAYRAGDCARVRERANPADRPEALQAELADLAARCAFDGR